MPSEAIVSAQDPAPCAASSDVSRASSSPLDPRRGGPVGALTGDDVMRAVAYLEALFRARGDPIVYANDERRSSSCAISSSLSSTINPSTPPAPAPSDAPATAAPTFSTPAPHNPFSSASSASSAPHATPLGRLSPHPLAHNYRTSPPVPHPAHASTALSSISRSIGASAEPDDSEPGSLAFEASPRRSSFGLDDRLSRDDMSCTLGMGPRSQDPDCPSFPQKITRRHYQNRASRRRGANPHGCDASPNMCVPSQDSGQNYPSDGPSKVKFSRVRERNSLWKYMARFLEAFATLRRADRDQNATSDFIQEARQDPAVVPTSRRPVDASIAERNKRRSNRSRAASAQDVIVETAQMDRCRPEARAVWAATLVVAAAAKRMNNDDFPYSVSTPAEDESLRSRRAAHRLLLAILGFDGAHGLVAVGKTEYAEAGFRDDIFDQWTLCDAKLSLVWKAHKAHAKATTMLLAVCRGLQDAVRALDRASAAAKKEVGSHASPNVSFIGRASTPSPVLIGSRSKPSRFWADAREKTTQVTYVLGKLFKYDPNLPVVCLLRDSRPGQPAPFRVATAKLVDPMPSNPTEAARLIEYVRAALLDAREVALETLEQTSQLVDTSAGEAVDARHSKIVADTALIDSRFQLVHKSLSTLETDPVSLRLMFEISETMKAQEREAGIAKRTA